VSPLGLLTTKLNTRFNAHAESTWTLKTLKQAHLVSKETGGVKYTDARLP